MDVGRRFCGRCGQEFVPAARFCIECGHPVSENADQTSAPPDAGTSPPAPRSVFLWPVVAVLAVLLAGGGFAASLALIRHFYGASGLQDNLAEESPTTASPTPSGPPPPSTQVTMSGTTIGIGAVNADPDATAVAATLATYFGGINVGKYSQAWDTYTAALQAAIQYQYFATAVSTSRDSQVIVQSIQHDAKGNVEVNVSFQSHQAGRYGPNQGETCTNWSLDYHLVPAADTAAGPASLSYLIDKVTDIGAGHTSC